MGVGEKTVVVAGSTLVKILVVSSTDGILVVSSTDGILPVSSTNGILTVSSTDGILTVSSTEVVSSTDGLKIIMDEKSVVLMVKKLEDTMVVAGLGVMGMEEVGMTGGFSRMSSIAAFMGPAIE